MKISPLLFAVLFTCGTRAATAQSTREPQSRAFPCLVDPAKVPKNFLTFDQFDQQLRDALTRRDTTELAFLVQFPLRVLETNGSLSINDAAALEAHFDEFFPPVVRKDILGDPEQPIKCNIEGITYGSGYIWVNPTDRGYAITTLSHIVRLTDHDTPGIRYTCDTTTHRIVIDDTGDLHFRYRAWTKPHPLSLTPDLTINDIKQNFEGSDLCAYQVFTSTHGTVTYTVDAGMGCDAEPSTPKDATGSLTIHQPGKPPINAWCF